MQLPPGDFLSTHIAELQSQGESVDMAKIEFLRQQYGLDRSPIEQYFHWIVGMLQGDFGYSFEFQLPVTKEGDLSDVPAAGVKMAGPEGDHASVLNGDQWKKAVQAYLATISFLDDQVGRLLDGLDASPRKDKTIIVWWTDHGWHLGEKEHWRKFALWEEATRTSMAIIAPGVT